MKQTFYYLWVTLAMLVLVSSCSENSIKPQNPDNITEFSISANLPGGISSYLSDKGGVSNVDRSQYIQRYILEAWTKEDTPRLAHRSVKLTQIGEGVTFTERLVAMEYTFVFWADFVPSDSQGEDFIYQTNGEVSELGLRAITFREGSNRYAGNELADAYTEKIDVNLLGSSSSLGNITLKRPFGKIRLISIDEKYGSNLLGIYPSESTVNYGSSKLPDSFDALEGKAFGEAQAGTYSFKAVAENVTVNSQEYPASGEDYNAYVLGCDYIFASDNYPSFSFDIDITSNEGTSIGGRTVSSVPVKRNMLTTVIGCFYTNEGSLSISVDENFEGEEVLPVLEEAESISDFLSKTPSEDIWYKLTGAITEISNATYGYLTITDKTASVYVYGLTSSKVSDNDKSFGELGLNVGDTLTLGCIRDEYNGTPQASGPAYYISHKVNQGSSQDTSYPVEFIVSGTDKAYLENASINGETLQVLKLGTGSATGKATFVIPAGTKRIELYAVSWKGNSSSTLQLQGECSITPSDIAPAPNDGASGNQPYSITASDTDKYVFDITGADSDKTITISTAGQSKRVIIWNAVTIK